MRTGLAVAVALALPAAAGAGSGRNPVLVDGIPSSVAEGWSTERCRPASCWREVWAIDEWGEMESSWVRARDLRRLDLGEAGSIPLFRLDPVHGPDGADESDVSYKRAVLLPWAMSRAGEGGRRILTAPGIPLTAEPAVIEAYGEAEKEPGDWVVLPPRGRLPLGESPMAGLSTWPHCFFQASPEVVSRLHPAELDLAGMEAAYAGFRGSGPDGVLGGRAGDRAEVPFLLAQSLRGLVYPKAAREASESLAGRPARRFTPFEAAFLHCRVNRLGHAASRKFYADMAGGKERTAFVRGWRGFIRASVEAYLREAKDLPGAKEAPQPWNGYEGHDHARLRAALDARTVQAVASGGAAPLAKAPRRKVTASVRERVKKAGLWAEELVR